MADEPRHTPHSHAPYWAFSRADLSVESWKIAGSASANVLTPSSASMFVIGLAFLAYSDSTAWAIALTPEVEQIVTCNERVRSTSYITVSGRILGSERVTFLPLSVSPRMGVISLPEYVVGRQICFSPVRVESALPNPTTEPPPMEMIQSASCDFSEWRACSVTDVGVCITAMFRIPAGVIEASSRTLANNSPCDFPEFPFEVRMIGDELSSLLISSGSLLMLFEPNTTRLGLMLYSNEFMLE